MQIRFSYSILVLTLFLFLPVFVIADDITLSGYTLYTNGTAINNTNITVEVYNMTSQGPSLLFINSTTSNSTGYFSLNITGNPNYMYKPVLIKYKTHPPTDADYIGQSLPMFPYNQFSQLNGDTIRFYLKPAATLFINATKNGSPVNFTYSIKDTSLGYEITSEHSTQVDNVTVYVPADRNYSIELFPFHAIPASYELNNISDYSGTSPHIDLTLNVTDVNKWVSGYVGSGGYDDLDIIAYLVEPGNIVFFDYPMPYNMSAFRGPNYTDTYNTATGFYNITIPGSALNTSVILFAIAHNASGYYGGFKNLTLNDASSDTEVNFTTVYQLAGNETNITLDNANGGQINVTCPLKIFNVTGEDGAPGNALIQLEANYTDYGYSGSSFIWTTDVDSNDNGIFRLPLFVNQTDDIKITIFTQEYAPLEDSLGSGDIGDSTDTVVISLDPFNPRSPDNTDFSDIAITMYKSTSECNVPNPPSTCILTDSQNISAFSPFGVVIGGGDITLRIRKTSNNITVQYNHVDLLASGPPDAMFDSEASSSQSGNSLSEAWRFGSKGPEIYDSVLIGIPYTAASSTQSGFNESEPIVVRIPRLYDNTWSTVWQYGSGDPLPSDYSDYNTSTYAAYINGTNVTCNTTDANLTAGLCYMDTTNDMIWIKIPHFSGIQPDNIGDYDKANGQSCSAASECYGGYCVHGYCRSSSTYCGDGYCDSGETSSSCPSDCGSSGGGSSTGTATKKTFVKITPGVAQIMKFYNKATGIKQIKIQVKNKVQNVKITITKVDGKPATITKEISGKVYKYMNIDHENINDSDIDTAEIEFEVEKSWLTDNNLDPDSIKLMRYHNDDWEILETEKTSETANYYYYKAKTPGFSYFAIVGNPETATTTTTSIATTTTTTISGTTTTTIPKEGIRKYMKYICIGILAVIIIFLIFVFSKRK